MTINPLTMKSTKRIHVSFNQKTTNTSDVTFVVSIGEFIWCSFAYICFLHLSNWRKWDDRSIKKGQKRRKISFFSNSRRKMKEIIKNVIYNMVFRFLKVFSFFKHLYLQKENVDEHMWIIHWERNKFKYRKLTPQQHVLCHQYRTSYWYDLFHW